MQRQNYCHRISRSDLTFATAFRQKRTSARVFQWLLDKGGLHAGGKGNECFPDLYCVLKYLSALLKVENSHRYKSH